MELHAYVYVWVDGRQWGENWYVGKMRVLYERILCERCRML